MTKTFYQCQRCAACCRWPGIVKVSEREIDAISRFLSMETADFIERFTRLRPDRKGLTLIEKANGECVFLDGIDCKIQPVKPRQCSGFPNTWRFPGFEATCEAIPIEISPEEYRRRVGVPETPSINALPSQPGR